MQYYTIPYNTIPYPIVYNTVPVTCYTVLLYQHHLSRTSFCGGVSNILSGLDPSMDERQMLQVNKLEQTECLLLKEIEKWKHRDENLRIGKEKV